MKEAKPPNCIPIDASGITRRGFLGVPLLSTGLLLPGLLNGPQALAVNSSAASAPVAENPGGRLAIGYWYGSGLIEDFGALSHSTGPHFTDELNATVDTANCTASDCQPLVNADLLASGDPEFAGRGARLRIHGLFGPALERLATLPALSLYVHAGVDHSTPFYAWGLTQGRVPAVSGPSQFQVPVDSQAGLRVSVEIGDGPAAVGHPATPGLRPQDPGFYDRQLFVDLRLDGAMNRPKLQRGVYLLAWDIPTRPLLPNWHAYRMQVTQPASAPPVEETAEVIEDKAVEQESYAAVLQETADATPDPRTFSHLAPAWNAWPANLPAYLMISVEYADADDVDVNAGGNAG